MKRQPADTLFTDTVPSPCYVIDEDLLLRNCDILDRVQQETNVRILLALKAFAAWNLFPLLSRAKQGCLFGTCASSVDEARLGREEFGGEVHVFSSGYDEESVRELLGLADVLIFNSVAQFTRFYPLIQEYANVAKGAKGGGRPIRCGLRINPEYSEVETALYDPCHPSSRLGVRRKDFDESLFDRGLSGLHFHTLCEQNADALSRTMAVCEQHFDRPLSRCAWINLGGGHHITRSDYDIPLLCSCLTRWQERYHATLYLEPGEAVALNCGWLKATVLDVVQAEYPVLILNVSVTCHMPDVLEMPYRPHVLYRDRDSIREAGEPEQDAGEGSGVSCRLAGNSCLAGDMIPYLYTFPRVPKVGDSLLFTDMAIYTMVKSTTFNGLRLPSIAKLRGDQLTLIRTFGYEDFKSRLS